MNKKNMRFQAPMVGGNSLLVIFAVLCMTVFALLGLGTVQADKRLSDAGARTVEAYYVAEVEADSILAQLRSGNKPTGVSIDGHTYSYSCVISDTQELQVEVCIDKDGSWEILRWQAVPTINWEIDESQSVWNGE